MTTGGRPLVVLTRAEGDNKSLAMQLEQIGIASVSVPMIEVHPPADGGNALSAALADIDLYHWLALTSPNGVRAVAATFDNVGVNAWPDHLRLAVVGPTTASAARKLGWPVTFQPNAATSSHLVREFPAPPVSGPEEFGTQRILAALAELAAPTLAKGLRRRGYQVDQVVAYRTVEPELADAKRQRAAVIAAQVVIFASPSAVDRFVQRFGLDQVPALTVCIGPSTARRAKARKLGTVSVAEPHTEAGLVQAVADALGY